MRVSFINHAVILLSFFITLGISTSHALHNRIHFFVPVSFQFGILISLIALLIFTKWYSGRTVVKKPFYGILLCILFFGIGFSSHAVRLPNYQKSHYTKHISEDTSKLLQLKLRTELKQNTYYRKYIAEVLTVDKIQTNGLVLFHLKKDTLTSFAIDDVLLIKATITSVKPNLNPNQFNYSDYLKNLSVYAEIHTVSKAILKQEKGRTTPRGFSENLRNLVINKIETTPLKNEARSILQALVLGQKRDIDKQLYKAYAAAGALHILAVSGLHVGILYIILAGLLKPLTYFKFGNSVRSILIILLLWGFALLAGVSPSVVRAVTMFSLFAVAESLNRPTNSFNTLFLSYFILLLFSPNWLFHVGFQLSYLAVFSILWIQPKLYELYNPTYYLDRLFWGITTVTVAAQCGIIPLSLYYFNQFPGLFFVTNIVVLPILGLLLIGGIIMILLAVFQSVPPFYSKVYNLTIETLNNFIRWIAQQEAFLFTDIPFSEGKLLSSYCILISLVVLWKHPNFKNSRFVCISILLFIVVCFVDKKRYHYNECIIFHKNQTSIIGIKQNRELTLLSNDTTNIKQTYPIHSYSIQKGIYKHTSIPLPKVFNYNNSRFLVIDSLGVYLPTISADVLLLTSNPKINLERLLDSLQPQLVIADGSNYKSNVELWHNTCNQKKLPFHHTGTKGAFTIK